MFGGLFGLISLGQKVNKLRKAPEKLYEYADKLSFHKVGSIDGQDVQLTSGSMFNTGNPLLLGFEWAAVDAAGNSYVISGACAVRIPILKKTFGEDGEYVSINDIRYENGTVGLRISTYGPRLSIKPTFNWTDENNITHQAHFTLLLKASDVINL